MRSTGRAAARRALAGAVAAAAVVVGALAGGCADTSTPTSTAGTVGSTVAVATAPSGPGAVPGARAPLPGDAATLAGIGLRAEKIAEVIAPTVLVARNGTDSLYVGQKDGKVVQLRVDRQRDRTGAVTKTTYTRGATVLDISRNVADSGERGLLGLAFSRDGSKLYVHYSDRDGNTNVDEFRMNDEVADARSKRQVLFLTQPFPNHNGGQISFGPDGFLYVGLGDGGSQGDPNGNGQNTDVLLGKILRIDPDGAAMGKPYGIPDGNPFAAGGGAPEVWAYGLRNPWRFSWDKATGDLWIGDVGGDEREEIDYLPAVNGGAGRGANLGWNQFEGTLNPSGGPAPAGYVPPIHEYGHGAGECSVVGGHVYRGKAIPALTGVYIYADYCLGEVRGLLRTGVDTVEEAGFGIVLPKGPLVSNGAITSFGTDADGEVFVLDAAGGVFKLQPG